ncbi:hypothetical protein CAP31_08635 [Sulfuriferula sp. AH1]|uniref:hypothetical protein n=1 Tax=Sulfuriferula sp. AH1 TaxID=1985873 RepID=UPI000B3B9A80|nr:hypothetical protein [Sulfuriferula sp. AH1]ARU31740.1 hypothetical protein CAP31_08635 [Sulfuriferula sp. AH1]
MSAANTQILLASLLGDREIVAFRPALARRLGAIPALFLCQACYWQGIAGAGEWWFKLRDGDKDQNGNLIPPTKASRQSWEWELGLGRGEQEEARKILKQHGLLEERRLGVPAKLHYLVNLKNLSDFLLNNQQIAVFHHLDGEMPPSRWQESTNKMVGIQPSNTETNAKITTKIKNTTTTAVGGSVFNELPDHLQKKAWQATQNLNPDLQRDVVDELIGQISEGVAKYPERLLLTLVQAARNENLTLDFAYKIRKKRAAVIRQVAAKETSSPFKNDADSTLMIKAGEDFFKKVRDKAASKKLT